MHLRHRWEYILRGVDQGGEFCVVCGKLRDTTAAQRSRSSVRLGKDVERRLARRFGWLKVGQLGDSVDLLGRSQMVKVQSKATRATAPLSFPGYGIVPVGLLRKYTEPLAKMDAMYPDRWPVLALSYVHQGQPTATWLVVRREDWERDYRNWSPPNPLGLELLLMSGDYWLDVVGKDTLDRTAKVGEDG